MKIVLKDLTGKSLTFESQAYVYTRPSAGVLQFEAENWNWIENEDQ